MKDRLLLSDEEEEYLIRKSKRERRCECSSSKMLLILTVVLTFAFGKLKIYNLKYIHSSDSHNNVQQATVYQCYKSSPLVPW